MNASIPKSRTRLWLVLAAILYAIGITVVDLLFDRKVLDRAGVATVLCVVTFITYMLAVASLSIALQVRNQTKHTNENQPIQSK